MSTERKRENNNAYVFQMMGLLGMQSMSFVTHDSILPCVLFVQHICCISFSSMITLGAFCQHNSQQKVKKKHSVPFSFRVQTWHNLSAVLNLATSHQSLVNRKGLKSTKLMQQFCMPLVLTRLRGQELQGAAQSLCQALSSHTG